MDYSPPDSSVHGILQARILEWVVRFHQGIFPTQGLNLGLQYYGQILYCLSHWEAQGFTSVQFSSVTQLCPTLCDPMDCSMSGLPVHHQLLEFTQIHVH